MLKVIETTRFKKCLKKYKHNRVVLRELAIVINLLSTQSLIPEKYKNHKLIGKHKDVMELHLRPDDLLFYAKIEKQSITLMALGSHADVFG